MKYLQACEIYYRRCTSQLLAVATLRSYGEILKDFGEFLSHNAISDVEKIKEDEVQRYITSKAGICSHSTIRTTFIVLRALFKELARRGVIPFNPMECMKCPKVPKKPIKAFTKGEINEILATYDKSSFVGLRNYTIMMLLFGTGARRAELLQIRIEDIVLETRQINITGKGGKVRCVPIGDVLTRAILYYLRKRKEYIKENQLYDSGYFIINNKGEHLNKGTLEGIFLKLRDNNKAWAARVSAHTWRHTFAKMFLLNGGDVFTLQKILGHEDIKSTRIYVNLTDIEIKTQNDKYNPLENSRWKYY